ncbi:MAG: hypothetical protein Q8R76_01225 [Candidatus Omnitrophota bacterium]|nr:hypothetical protein [Candidatus Omnitrophota bacterium]
MNTIMKSMALLTAGMVMLYGPAMAQSQAVTGKITKIDKAGNSLTVQAHEKLANMPREVKLYLQSDADRKGFDSLDNLNVGDEVRVDAERQQAWFAKSLEATARKGQGGERNVEGSDAQQPGFFGQAVNRIQAAWYEFRSDIRTNPEAYEEYADNRITRAESRLSTLRQEADAPTIVGSEAPGEASGEQSPAERTQMLHEIEPQLAQAKQDLQNLQKLEPYEVEQGRAQADATEQQQLQQQRKLSSAWSEAKSELAGSLDDVHSSINKAVDQFLSEKRAYEWETEDELDEMRYDIAELKKAGDEIRADQKPEVKNELQQSINDLEGNLQDVEQKLQQVKNAGEGEWKDMRGEIKNSFDTFRSGYYDSVGKVGS